MKKKLESFLDFSKFSFCEIKKNKKLLNSQKSFFKVGLTFLIFFDHLFGLHKPTTQLSVGRHFTSTKFLKMDETIDKLFDVVQIVFLQQVIFQQMSTPLFIDVRRRQNVSDERHDFNDDFRIDVIVVVEMSHQNVVSLKSVEGFDVRFVAARQRGKREDETSDQLVAFAGP